MAWHLAVYWDCRKAGVPRTNIKRAEGAAAWYQKQIEKLNKL